MCKLARKTPMKKAIKPRPAACQKDCTNDGDGETDCDDVKCTTRAIHEGGYEGLKLENGANVATCTGGREAAVDGMVTIQPAAGYPSPSNEQCFII